MTPCAIGMYCALRLPCRAPCFGHKSQRSQRPPQISNQSTAQPTRTGRRRRQECRGGRVSLTVIAAQHLISLFVAASHLGGSTLKRISDLGGRSDERVVVRQRPTSSCSCVRIVCSVSSAHPPLVTRTIPSKLDISLVCFAFRSRLDR
jgi:hypothetical protein